MDNGHVTIEQICLQTGLTNGTVIRIIKEDLKIAKVNAKCVPKMLGEKKKEMNE